MGLLTKKARTPADVQADITALAELIDAKARAIDAIDQQVRAAVASGDMQTADGLDSDLIRERQALERLRSRDAILAEALAAAQEEAAKQSAQAARENALAAQAIGHALLLDYEKQAAALAATLEKLAAVDRFIERRNADAEGKAEPVGGLYRATRFKPEIRVDGIERWYEYPGHGPAHPEFDPCLSVDGEIYNRLPPPPLRIGDDEDGNPIYIDAVLMKRTAPNAIVKDCHRMARPIDELAVLPGSKIDDPDLWNGTRRREAQVQAEKIVADLMGDTSKRRKAWR